MAYSKGIANGDISRTIKPKSKGNKRRDVNDLINVLNVSLQKYADQNGLDGYKAAARALNIPQKFSKCTAKQLSGFNGMIRAKLKK